MKKDVKKIEKHKRPSWDEYFLSIAEQVAKKSKDPSTQNGCVIVDEKNRPVSFGYNGFIGGCNESKMTYERPMKYHLIIHDAMNAIIFAKRDLTTCTLYDTYGPCENCLKHIIQSGIKRIIYGKAFVESKVNKHENSMVTDVSSKAITRILLSAPWVECCNVNGKTYLQEIWNGKKLKI
jgi:dCMP deaminase